jgi:hypothetical protein
MTVDVHLSNLTVHHCLASKNPANSQLVVAPCARCAGIVAKGVRLKWLCLHQSGRVYPSENGAFSGIGLPLVMLMIEFFKLSQLIGNFNL